MSRAAGVCGVRRVHTYAATGYGPAPFRHSPRDPAVQPCSIAVLSQR